MMRRNRLIQGHVLAMCLGLGALIAVGCQNDEAVARNASGNGYQADSSWDEFQAQFELFYAYSDRRDFDVEALLKTARSEAIKTKTPDEFRHLMTQWSYLFADPHLGIRPLTDEDYNVIPTSSDLKVGWSDEGELRVVDVRQGSAADAAGIRPSWTIRLIEGENPETASRHPFGPFAKSLTTDQLAYGANLAVNGRRLGDRSLVFATPDGQERSMELESPRLFARAVSQKTPVELAIHEDHSIGVITINNALGDNSVIGAFDTIMTQTSGLEGLIIDLRNTPSGGNTEVARSILGHFVTEAKPYQMHRRPSLEREFSVPRQWVEYVLPRSPEFKGPVIVLGGHWTGSMGEGLVIGFDASTTAKIITSDMGDLLGALGNFDLNQSGLGLEMGYESLFHVDGTPREDFEGDVHVMQSDRDSDGNDPMIPLAVSMLSEDQDR